MALANAYNNYGVLLAQNKQWTEAESYLEQAIQISPNPNNIKFNLSNIYFTHGNEIYTNPQYTTYTSYNAKQYANKAIATDPSNVNGYLLLGDIEYMDQNMQAAQSAWQHAARLVPNNQEVQKRLAQISHQSTFEAPMTRVFNPYFNIKIDPSVAQNSNLNINTILNYAHEKVSADLHFYQRIKVPVVVYNKDDYHEAMQEAPGWSEASYDGKIRIAIYPNQTNFKQLTSDVVHEYTHVVVSAMTHNNCPRWFNEGLAKYEEYRFGNPPRIYLLALAYNTNELIKWDAIDAQLVSSNKNQVLLAYQQAFSFVYYLIQRYGMYKVIQLLKALGTNMEFPAAVQKVYNTPIEKLQTEWQQWLTDFLTNWAEKPATTTSGGDY